MIARTIFCALSALLSVTLSVKFWNMFALTGEGLWAVLTVIFACLLLVGVIAVLEETCLVERIAKFFEGKEADDE